MKCDNILLESCVKRNFPNVKSDESLDGNGLGKVQEGLFMREVSWPSPPQQSIQKIHIFKYTSANTQIQEVSQEHKGRSQQTLATKL